LNIIRNIAFHTLRLLTRTDQNLILLLYWSYSGSNTIALYKKKTNCINDNYKVKLMKTHYSGNCLLKKISHYKSLFEGKLIVTTHGFLIPSTKNQIIIESWHGFPLKGMGLMDNSENFYYWLKTVKTWQKKDVILSYSKLYSVLLSSCGIGIEIKQYHVTGMPRNDFLFDNNKNELLRILNIPNKRKIIFYMPTFRIGYKNRIEGSIANRFDFVELNKFLGNNNLHFILKLHPNEEKLLEGVYNIAEKFENISLLKNSHLEENDLDLYELLGSADLIITDYSSVYFDFLLLDRPIVFYPIDLDIYRRKRGFLLEPYDFWTSGPKATNQKNLQDEILKSLSDKNYYAKERKMIRNIVHYYQDNKSSERVWNLISKILTFDKK